MSFIVIFLTVLALSHESFTFLLFRCFGQKFHGTLTFAITKKNAACDFDPYPGFWIPVIFAKQHFLFVLIRPHDGRPPYGPSPDEVPVLLSGSAPSHRDIWYGTDILPEDSWGLGSHPEEGVFPYHAAWDLPPEWH